MCLGGRRQEGMVNFCPIIGVWQSSHCRLQSCQACSGRCRKKRRPYCTWINFQLKMPFSILYHRGMVAAPVSDACTSLDLAHTIRWLCTFQFLHEKTFLAKFAKIYSPKRTHAQFKKTALMKKLVRIKCQLLTKNGLEIFLAWWQIFFSKTSNLISKYM